IAADGDVLAEAELLLAEPEAGLVVLVARAVVDRPAAPAADKAADLVGLAGPEAPHPPRIGEGSERGGVDPPVGVERDDEVVAVGAGAFGPAGLAGELQPYVGQDAAGGHEGLHGHGSRRSHGAERRL